MEAAALQIDTSDARAFYAKYFQIAKEFTVTHQPFFAHSREFPKIPATKLLRTHIK